MSNRFKDYHAARQTTAQLTQDEIQKLTTANNAGSNHAKEEWIKSTPQPAEPTEDELEKERTIQRDMARDQKAVEQKGK